ncbi:MULTISPECIES: DUF1109 domain-containing protein [unclassified Variovorax]|uniref:DUF1109 domain-containing protein n=1 Tax=unclassified Variovorax TaxID=663243 RepID=UPI00076CC286|nr:MULTISPECIES: DUF1109 domain-containing protein [unclassified Variovorax]KWT65670.1 extracytoplasmic function alternative sigma factor [Variovorax sp. WDL1]PNG56695.1 hypothetical protein CHC07_03117 [Variovorax sp. B4]PNG58119.1 hypothetical protein CHC06_03120 [Variovorax sp. B2]VTV09382.1 hypothetical protein WDL1CHR_00505 [Variovorax sp. WDL1]
MKTDELVALLAARAEPVPRHAAARRIGLALAAGLPISIAVMIIEYGVRRDLVQTMFWPMFWVKLLFPACIAVAGFVVVQRLARPGVRVHAAWLGLAVPVLLVWALGMVTWLMAPVDERAAMVWGQSWQSCAFSIALISVPVFVASLAALKGLAPTQPALAGAAAGAMSAGAGAAVYALHCQELAAPFLAIWYVIGMALPVGAGALIGRRLLRW